MISLLASNPLFGSFDEGFYFFSLEVRYYAIMMILGIFVATVLSALLMKRRNMSTDFIFLLFVICVPIAIVGARLFSCLTDPNLGIGALFKFPWAGLSVTGSLIGGVGAGLVVCLIKKVNFLRAADCIVVTILLAQAIGRWGNFFNQEVFGGVVTNPSWQWFPFAVYIERLHEWHYAFFFYEGVINVIGFALLYSAAWFWKKKPNGLFICAYFVWYGTVRTVMEPLRYSDYILDGGGIMWSQVFSILMIVGGLGGIGILLALNYRKEGSLFGSKKGDPCGITEFLTPYKDEKPYFSKINMFGKNYPPKPYELTLKGRWEKFKSKFHKDGGDDTE